MSNEIEELFPELKSCGERDYARMGTDKPVLMVAMTARTGSNHLCSSLASVVTAARPFEMLNARSTLKFAKTKFGMKTFSDVIAHMTASANECVIFNTHWMDFDYFQDRLFWLFPNLTIAYLDRFDREAQAVSLLKAIASRQWHDAPGYGQASPVPAGQLIEQFDLRKLCLAIRHLEDQRRQWEDFFFARDLQPLRLFYEHFRKDPRPAVERILDRLGLPAERAAEIRSEYRPMSDIVNQTWLTRLRAYRYHGSV